MLDGMRKLVLATAVPLALLLGACGQDVIASGVEDPATARSSSESPSASASPSDTSGDTSAAAKKSKSSPQATPALLDFSSTTVEGADFDGASLAGKPTVLWFWAPWCPTCRGQIPQVEQLAADFDGEVNVIGIGALDSAEAISDFAGDVDGVTHLEDVEGELWKRFAVTEQSSFVVLDADGTVTFEAGYGGTGDLDAEVRGLLG